MHFIIHMYIGINFRKVIKNVIFKMLLFFVLLQHKHKAKYKWQKVRNQCEMKFDRSESWPMMG